VFQGVFTALVTPFDEQGQLDESALRDLVDAQIEGGVSGLVPMGTTGESPTVTHEEHTRIIKIVVQQAAGRVPIVAGTGSNSTQEAIELTKKAAEAGADASLQVNPYYNKPTQEGLYRHFTAVAEEGGLPIIVYNIPGRTAITVTNETMLRLAKHERVVGVKEATGDFPSIMDLIRRRPEGFAVLSGDDNISMPMIALGGDGVVSVASNLIPAHMTELISAALRDDMKTARKLQYRLLPLFKALFLETNPIPVKAAMAMKGMIKATYRLPMCPLSESHHTELESVLKELSIL
jgi:4-hydroxy-tetrahydrodipicolinate synthase